MLPNFFSVSLYLFVEIILFVKNRLTNYVIKCEPCDKKKSFHKNVSWQQDGVFRILVHPFLFYPNNLFNIYFYWFDVFSYLRILSFGFILVQSGLVLIPEIVQVDVVDSGLKSTSQQ